MICTDSHIDLVVDIKKDACQNKYAIHMYIDNATSSYLALYTMIKKVETWIVKKEITG